MIGSGLGSGVGSGVGVGRGVGVGTGVGVVSICSCATSVPPTCSSAVSSVLQSAMSRASSEQILKILVEKVGRQEGHELLRKHATARDYREAILHDSEILKHAGKDELLEIFGRIDVGLSVEKVESVLSAYESSWKSYRSTLTVQ